MKNKQPRQYSLVRFDPGDIDVTFLDKYPFRKDGLYVFLGEIPNMTGHCVVVDHKTGVVHSGYHTENFVEIPEDEA